MNKKYRPRRDFEGLRKRRLKAGRMFEEGLSQAEVHRTLKVSRPTAHRWYHEWKEKGRKALEGAKRAGRKSRLSSEHLRNIDKALRKGPRAHGYVTDLWTVPRITRVIESITGISYHEGHVWKLLQQLGWSVQRPARRAQQRDEKQVLHWIKSRWPALKKSPKR